MPQSPSKTTIGTRDPFIQSLPTDVPLSISLEGSKYYSLAEARQGPEIPSKFTSDFPPVHKRQRVRKSLSQNSPKAQ
jgi:hypothetical protein